MTLLLTLLFKSLLVFAAAGTLLFLLRRSSAAARHLVCLLTLGAVLASAAVFAVASRLASAGADRKAEHGRTHPGSSLTGPPC